MIKVEKSLIEKIAKLSNKADFAFFTDCILENNSLIRNVILLPKQTVYSQEKNNFFDEIIGETNDDTTKKYEPVIPQIKFNDLKEILPAKNSITREIWSQLPENEDPIVNSDGTILFSFYIFCAKMNSEEYLNFRIEDLPSYSNFMNLPERYNNQDLKEIHNNKLFHEGMLLDKNDKAILLADFLNEISYIELADYHICELELKHLKKLMTY